MEFDVAGQPGAGARSVSFLERDGRPAAAITVSRSYRAKVEDLWDAVTSRERLPRWFLPVAGDLEAGGRYQLEGNAGGVITACERLSRLALTWEFGADVSWVEVRIAEAGAGRARLALTHAAHLSDHWNEYGPGATGVGWELGLLALQIHLTHPAGPKLDDAAFAASRDGKAFIRGSSEGWEQAAAAAGADPGTARTAARRTAAFYTGGAAETA